MKIMPRWVLCYGLVTGLLFWRVGPVAAAETATIGAASQDGSPPSVELITYPAPTGIAASPLYSVSVGLSGSLRRSFVYSVNNIGLAQYNWQGHGWNIRSELTTAWTSFDFRGPRALDGRQLLRALTRDSRDSRKDLAASGLLTSRYLCG
jgi:hypothetical protein